MNTKHDIVQDLLRRSLITDEQADILLDNLQPFDPELIDMDDESTVLRYIKEQIAKRNSIIEACGCNHCTCTLNTITIEQDDTL